MRAFGQSLYGVCLAAALCALILASGTPSAYAADRSGPAVAQAPTANANDPLEDMNRYFFEVNYALDELLLKPLAGWYRTALPRPARNGIRNFIRNMRSPVVLANDLLQGDLDRAGVTTGRFVINTTVGLLGILDVAEDMGLQYHDEDFGQTLAVWGVPEGPYLVVPVLGPSNPRDLAGRVVDLFFDPVFYLANVNTSFTDPDEITTFWYVRTGLATVDARSRAIEELDEVRRSSLDYYASIRSLYRQRRDAQIRNADTGDAVGPAGIAPPPEENGEEGVEPAPGLLEEEGTEGAAPAPGLLEEETLGNGDTQLTQVPPRRRR